jgi:hypothetical protein
LVPELPMIAMVFMLVLRLSAVASRRPRPDRARRSPSIELFERGARAFLSESVG